MTLELVRPIVTFLLLQGTFLAGCAWWGHREDGTIPAVFWGGLALLLGATAIGYVLLWVLMGPIR